MAQRARGGLPRGAGQLARDLRGLHRRRRRQRDLPRPCRRRRPPDDGAPGRQGVDVHDARQLEPRARDRRLGLRDRPLRLGSDPGRVPELRRAPVAAELRLRLVPRPPAGLADPARDRRLRPHRARDLDPEQCRRSSAATSARRSPSSARPARWLRTVVVWQLADWALRLDHDLVHARCLRDQPDRCATCCSSRRRRASPRSCRSAPAASGRSRRSSSTRSAARLHARRCSPSASA